MFHRLPNRMIQLILEIMKVSEVTLTSNLIQNIELTQSQSCYIIFNELMHRKLKFI